MLLGSRSLEHFHVLLEYPMRRATFSLLTLLLIAFAAHHADASLAPASVSLSLGTTNELGPDVNTYTPVPSVSALWSLGSHVSAFRP